MQDAELVFELGDSAVPGRPGEDDWGPSLGAGLVGRSSLKAGIEGAGRVHGTWGTPTSR